MKNRFIFIVILCFTIGIRAQSTIENQLNELLQSDLLVNSEVGISVRDLTEDRILYQYNSRKRSYPASTQKLITCISALHFLKKEHPVVTGLWTDGRIEDGKLKGNLYVSGGFDSEFVASDMTQLVQELSNRGIHRIEGYIYGDLSMKDSLPYGSGWCWDDALFDFQPVLSPLIFQKGYITVRATPSRAGEPAQIRVTPVADCYRIENRTVSSRSTAGPFRVSRNLFTSSDLITVSGNVAGEQSKNITLPRPEDLFLSIFMQQLNARGINHSGFGGYRDRPLHEAESLGSFQRPLHELIRRALKVSDNLSAEAVFYQLATYWKGERRASALDAVSAINHLMWEMGMDAAEFSVADGSGLSRYNYVTADMLVSFLQFATYDPELMNALYPTLPVAGIDGTLRNRMKGCAAYNNVRAKTGTITGASSLAGYLTASNGHIIAFAILNQNMKNGKEAHAFQDRICEILCR